MSKTLFLLRHAKSSWDDLTLADHDRPLSQRGIKAAPLMAKAMLRYGWVPDFALVSSALRTQQTWALVKAEFSTAIEIRTDASIYEASAQSIASAIRGTPDHVTNLIVIGHNPGLEELCDLISSYDSSPDAIDNLNQKFPTAALARFSYSGSWRELAERSARLTHFITPRQVGNLKQ